MTPTDPGSKKKKAALTKPPTSFEAGMEELETLVTGLEDGTLDLESSIASFERGMHLLKHLSATLGEAETRMKVLLSEDGELLERLADEAEGDDE